MFLYINSKYFKESYATRKYFKFNFTCIIHNEAIGREPGYFPKYSSIRHKMKQLPGPANCSGESLLPRDIKRTHTSAYLELKPQLMWLCSSLPVPLKSLLEKEPLFLPFHSCIISLN